MERITEIDLLRGLALLGIFLMNIVAMAYPLEAYTNPFAFDVSNWYLSEAERLSTAWTINDIVFSVLHVFVDQKMMGLFSLLFGVSTMLFLEKLREQDQGLKFYFIRNGWLMLFGFLHAIFLFIGDILLIYGFCAMFLLLFARLKPQWKILLGLVIFYVPVVMLISMQSSVVSFAPEQLNELEELWRPSVESVRGQIEWMHIPSYGSFILNNLGFLEVVDDENSIEYWYGNALFFEGFARSFGMMLVGMGMYQFGFLSNLSKHATAAHFKISAIGMLLGVTIAYYGLWLNYSHDWQASYSAIIGRVANNIATPLMTLAYAMLCVAWVKNVQSIHFKKLQIALQAVGRMALSNYIAQSMIGVFLFTGVGLALFGRLSRFELLLIVLCVWAIQLSLSVWWMKRFRFGPLEWLWRCLTYGKLVPMRVSE